MQRMHYRALGSGNGIKTMLRDGKKTIRRKGIDVVSPRIHLLVIVSWLLFILTVALLSVASQAGGGSGYQQRGARVSGDSASSLMGYSLLAEGLLLGACIYGLMLNSMRMKRKGDYYHKSFIILGVISLMGIVYSLIML
jgi:hypothetical protein